MYTNGKGNKPFKRKTVQHKFFRAVNFADFAIFTYPQNFSHKIVSNMISQWWPTINTQ